MIHQMQKLHGKRDDDETFKAVAGSVILFQRNSKRMGIVGLGISRDNYQLMAVFYIKYVCYVILCEAVTLSF